MKRRTEERRIYAWAEEVRDDPRRVRRLSQRARWGLDYACHFADNAHERQCAPLKGRPAPRRLTFAVLGREDHDFSAAEIEALVRQARIEVFGKDLSDRGIRYRMSRARERGERREPRCHEEECARPLPLHATARRRYCDFHLASHARVRRWRERHVGR